MSIVQFSNQSFFYESISTIKINSIPLKTQKNFGLDLVLKYGKKFPLHYGQRSGYAQWRANKHFGYFSIVKLAKKTEPFISAQTQAIVYRYCYLPYFLFIFFHNRLFIFTKISPFFPRVP